MNTHTFKPDLPPPSNVVGPVAWLRHNLFASPLHVVLTLLSLYLLWLILPPLLNWAVIHATWSGTTRTDCTGEGACWVFIQQRFGQFMYGFYP
ncbi:amino acid ABC transporter permease, partial [Klebsiella pneumoniae]|nr:amino acid ABC transporter permease [Klebsiella pneumoniae]